MTVEQSSRVRATLRGRVSMAVQEAAFELVAASLATLREVRTAAALSCVDRGGRPTASRARTSSTATAGMTRSLPTRVTSNPPTFAVLTWHWLTDASLAIQAQGSAAAIVMILLLLLAVAGGAVQGI